MRTAGELDECLAALETWAADRGITRRRVKLIETAPRRSAHAAAWSGPFSTGPAAAGVGSLIVGASAKGVLANGTLIRLAIISVSPLGMKSDPGVDRYAVTLNVLRVGQSSTQAEVGNPVPTNCLKMLYPGSNLPAQMLAGNPSDTAIGWDVALAAV